MRVPGNQFAGADRIGPAPVNYHRLLARTWEPIEFPGFFLWLTGLPLFSIPMVGQAQEG